MSLVLQGDKFSLFLCCEVQVISFVVCNPNTLRNSALLQQHIMLMCKLITTLTCYKTDYCDCSVLWSDNWFVEE